MLSETVTSSSLCKKIKKIDCFLPYINKMLIQDNGIHSFGYLKKNISMSHFTKGNVVKNTTIKIHKKNAKKYRRKINNIIKEDNKYVHYDISYSQEDISFHINIKKIIFYRDIAKYIHIDVTSFKTQVGDSGLSEIFTLYRKVSNATKTYYKTLFNFFEKPYIINESNIFLNLNKVNEIISSILEFHTSASDVIYKKIYNFLLSSFIFCMDITHRVIMKNKMLTLKHTDKPRTPYILVLHILNDQYEGLRISANIYEADKPKIIIEKSNGENITLKEFIDKTVHMFMAKVLDKVKQDVIIENEEENDIMQDNNIIDALQIVMLRAFTTYVITYMDILNKWELFKNNTETYYIDILITITDEKEVELSSSHRDRSYKTSLSKSKNGFLDKILSIYKEGVNIIMLENNKILRVNGISAVISYGEDFIFAVTYVYDKQPDNVVTLQLHVPFSFRNIINTIKIITDGEEPIDKIYDIAKRVSHVYDLCSR